MFGTPLEAATAAFVLYVDHEGHPSPLTECYHATASRRLSSSGCACYRPPASTVCEMDSAYCPQCLSSHDPASAAALGYCPKPACQLCPLCQSICSISTTSSKPTNKNNDASTPSAESSQIFCFYKCGLCEWSSESTALTQEIENSECGEEQSYSKVDFMRAVESLGRKLKSFRQEQDDAATTHYQHLSAAWSSSSSSSASAASVSNQMRSRTSREDFRQLQAVPEWSIETLEASLQEKQKTWNSSSSSPSSSAPNGMTRISIQDILKNSRVENAAMTTQNQQQQHLSMRSLQLQAVNQPLQQQQSPGGGLTAAFATTSTLLPLPLPLRVRQSRRCRAELAEGRPGILLKPKLNPLEGDSSLRTGHGQWWKKDSSAIHVIPRVRIVKHLARSDCILFLLRVTNPTLGPVRLRFTRSSYSGELVLDSCFAAFTGEGESEIVERTTRLEHLLLDSLSQIYSNIELKTDVLHRLSPTDTVELLSAEDSFIELGGKSREIPEQVAMWEEQQQTLAEDPSTVPTAKMKLVASSASTAWFELAIPPPFAKLSTELEADSSDVNKATAEPLPALPLALQIEVGNGSWESSLIQPQAPIADQPDRVTFDLVLVWQS